MNIKENCKTLIGRKNLIRLKKVLNTRKYLQSKFRHNTGSYSVNSDYITHVTVIGKKGFNFFFGYYDIAQLNHDATKALAHIVPKNANPATELATLVWIDLKDNMKIHEFATTNAWSWQQGARLRWHPCNQDCVMFNDYDGKNYVTRVFDIIKNQEVSVIPVPLYDVNVSGNYGLSLNFDRLQRLRPGYGYSNRPDKTLNDSAPNNDGIFLWEKQDNSCKCIITLKELAERNGHADNLQHYINHISISPSGKKFIFFHIWTAKAGNSWKTELYTANIDGTGLRCIDSDETVSHYAWNGDNELLITSLKSSELSSPHYIIYDLNTMDKKIVSPEKLDRDGHPTWIKNGLYFVSDTYPQKDCMQHLFMSNRDGTEIRELLKIYSNPFAIEEHRCDLHPRVDQHNKFISIDSSHKGSRSVLILKVGTLL